MNLANTITILAGGPGSGRHQEVFNGKNYKNVKENVIIGLNEHLNHPVMQVRVKDLLGKDPMKEHPKEWDKKDRLAVAKYEKQIKSGNYNPIFVTHYKSGLDITDGTHRAVAALRSGQEFILAHVLHGGKK